jgi:hypothetical protein
MMMMIDSDIDDDLQLLQDNNILLRPTQTSNHTQTIQQKQQLVYCFDVDIHTIWQQRMHELYQLDAEVCKECIHDFCVTYTENHISTLRQALECIVRDDVYDFLTRIQCAQALGNIFYVLEVCEAYKQDTKEDINFTIFCDEIVRAVQIAEVADKSIQEYCEWIFSIKSIPWVTKYKVFKSVCDYRVKSTHLLINLCKTIVTINPLSKYTVLCLQLVRPDFKTLSSIFQRTKSHQDIHIQSDIFDQYLDYKEFKADAMKQLQILGNGFRTLDNDQNVHMVTADVDQWLDWLCNQTQIMNSTEQHKMNIELCIQQIVEHAKSLTAESSSPNPTIQGIQQALQRIQFDNKCYGKQAMKLSTILCRLWYIILHHEHQHELIQRLHQELNEMNNWCTTGHLVRLMNVFVGFDYTALSIDPKIELKSVVTKRLQNYLNEVQDQDIVVKTYKPIEDESTNHINATMSSLGKKFTNMNLICSSTTVQEVDETINLYDIVMDAWVEQNDKVLQKYFYPQLSKIHDEVYADYVGQNIMSASDFSTYYRDIINNLFVKDEE